MSDVIVSHSGVGRNVGSAFSMEAEVELTQLVYGKGVERKSWSWRADDLIYWNCFEVFLFGLTLLWLGVTQELPARGINVFSVKERRLRNRSCEFYPCCFGRKSDVKRTQTIRAYAVFVYLQKPVVGVPVHCCSAINNKGRQQLTTCYLYLTFVIHEPLSFWELGRKGRKILKPDVTMWKMIRL